MKCFKDVTSEAHKHQLVESSQYLVEVEALEYKTSEYYICCLKQGPGFMLCLKEIHMKFIFGKEYINRHYMYINQTGNQLKSHP